jgi:hypothetical protein
MSVVGTVISKIPFALRASAAAVLILTLGLKKALEALLDMQIGFSDLPEIIGATVEQVASRFLGLADLIGTTIMVRVKQAFNDIVADAKTTVDALKSIFDLQLGSSPEQARLAAREREVEALQRLNKAAAENKKLELEITEAKKRQAQIDEDANKRAGTRIQNLRNAIERAQGDSNGIPVDLNTAPAEGSLASLLASVNDQITGLIGGDIVDEKAIAEKLAKLGEEISAKMGEITGKQQEVQLTAFDKMIQGLIKKSQGFLEVLQSAVQSFADFASSAIVDAFDPTKDVDLRERFARLLQDIAKQILQTLFTLLIATAIAKAFGVPLPSNNEAIPNLPEFAEGGSVPDSGSPIARPASVPKTDTTLAWLTPGEFVQTVGAVRTYGADVMEAIRQGAIDPLSLRSLAGLEGRRNVRRTVARSGALAFADGGLVPAAGVQATRANLDRSSANAAQPPIALVVGNEQSLDRLLAGGKRAMLDFMRSNAGSIDGILSKNRT